MLQRIAACQQCQGTYTGYVMYTFSAAQHAIENGDLWLSYGISTQEVSAISLHHVGKALIPVSLTDVTASVMSASAKAHKF